MDYVTGTKQEQPQDRQIVPRADERGYRKPRIAQFFGTLVYVDHPELATRSQNMLSDGTYLASFPLGQRGTSKNSL
jgi:hypothetical protein